MKIIEDGKINVAQYINIMNQNRLFLIKQRSSLFYAATSFEKFVTFVTDAYV